MSAGASSDTNEEEVILSYIESNPPPPLDNGPQAPPATPTETARDPAHDYGYEGELTNDYRGGITGSGDDPYYGYTDSSILEYDQQVVPSSFDGSSDHQSEAVPAAIVGSSSATDNPDGLHQAATTSNGPHKSSSCAHVSQNGAPQCGSPATRALPQPPVSKSGSEWHQAAHRDGAPREGGRVQDRLQSLHATQPQQQQGLRVSAVESGARPLPRPPMQSTSTVQCSQPTSAKPRPLPVPKTLTQSTQSQVQPTINPGPLPKPKLGAAEVLSTVHSKPASTPTPAANICSTSSVRPSLVPVPAATTQNKKISLSVSAPLKVLPPENPIPKAYSSPDSPSRPNIEASQLAQLALIARSAASKNGQSTEVQGHSLPIKGSSPPPAASAEVPPDKTSPSTDDLDSNPSALVFSSVFKKASLPSWEDQTRLLRQLAHYTTDQDEYNRKASEIQKMDEMRKMLEDKELLFAARNIAKLDEIIKSASRGPTTVSTSGAPLTSQIIPEGQKYHTEISFDQLKVGDLVGRGAAGKVYKGVYEGQEVAIKHYSEDNVQFNLKDFRKEIAIMSVLDHENLIRCIGACTADPQHLYIVTPLLKFSLASFLAQNEIDLVTCLDIAMGVTSGMCFLHAYHLIHRDLKTQNILLTDTLQVKIIDFGTSRIIDTASMMTTNIGTVQYMAPELFENKEYTEKADVYAFGIVLWEIASGEQPYSDKPSWAIPVAVSKGERPNISKTMNSELAKLIKACWSLLPAKRPSFTDIRASLRNILQDVRDQPMLLMPAFGRWEVTQRPIQGDLAKNLSNYAASSEKWTFSTEVLSFDFSNSSTNHPETQQFDIFNNTNSSFKYKIDKYTDCDLILAFTKGSGTIKPHTRKIIDVKVTVKIKTTKSLRIPVSLGTSKDFIDIIIRCDAGVFGVTPSLLPQGKEDDLKVPQILVDLKAALINNQGLQKVNIFLQAGDAAELKRLQELANRGEFSPKLPHNPHVIANLIKVWFRTLPQGLMNSISPNALMDSVTVLQCMTAIQQLGPYNMVLFEWLLRLLVLVCSNPANKTTPKSISITIAPNLFFAHDLETTKLSGKCSDMIQTLIQARIAAPATSNNQSSTSTSSSTGAPTNTTTPSSSTGAPTSTRTNSTGAPSSSPSSTCLSTGSSPSPSPRVISANSSASTSTGSN